ncbi:hypothetical protein LTR62_005591 [Meristemomyces frigidus]|uniref:Protein-lysine N-methyltransferase EFM6 n=1 Tax=Meristemomyces frigidus TaxID=1508187 RepID=A0AAN7TDY5_9PEZI|nr:hypothetical protein LTR62_005591 [Meristemomyces frigidus]
MSDDETNPRGAFAISEDLVQSPSHRQARTNRFDFDGLLQDQPLELHEDLAKGNGGQAWPAGQVLAKYLLRMKRDALQRCNSIVELGAGGGLVGLAVAVGCRPDYPVYITDQESMLELMQRNIVLNGLASAVHAAVYDWGEAQPVDVPAFPDVILAADCVYFEPAFPLLQATLKQLIGPSSICYFCFKKRRRADMQFVKAIKKTFVVEAVLDDPDREVYARENISL